jgi:hypothetical protein
MKRFTAKVYVAQQADREGRLGDILAVKLPFAAAHAIAKANAPAKVWLFVADKSPLPNSPVPTLSH